MGLFDAFGSWVGDWDTGSTFGILIVLLLAVYLLLAWESDDVLLRATAGFALISPLLTAAVWEGFFDISRAVAPVLTVLILVLWQRLFGSHEDATAPRGTPTTA